MKDTYEPVKKNRKTYVSLVKDLKFVTADVLSVDDKVPYRPLKLVCNQTIEHVSIKEENTLTIEAITEDNNKFKFKLKCPEIFEKHYLRFDSYGPPHKNKNPKKPYKSVKTPHFNVFDEDGYNIAYRTPELEQLHVSIGIQEHFTHFCHEANISHSGKNVPEIEIGGRNEIKFPNTKFNRILSIKFAGQ